MIELDNKWLNVPERLSIRDKNGDLPAITIMMSNRGGGKTYGVSEVLLDRYFDSLSIGEAPARFGLICRVKDEVGSFANGVLGGVLDKKYPGYTVAEVKQYGGRYSEIWLNSPAGDDGECHKEHIGFVLVLNMAYKLKNVSSAFISIETLFMDEFQTDRYLPQEIDKFITLYDSVSRGGDSLARPVKVIMTSNTISVENPYFQSFGISRDIHKETKRLKRDGLVVTIDEVADVADARANLGVHKVLAQSSASKSAISNAWLNDNASLICKQDPKWGRSIYMATLHDGAETYALRGFTNQEIFYVNRSPDLTCPEEYSLGENMENVQVVTMSTLWSNMRTDLLMGRMRFSDQGVKNAILDLLIGRH